jgi:antitoxin HigA-1
MPMKNPPHPGRLVKDNLDELGLSVAQAAGGLGVTRQQLYKVINGESAVSPEMAVRLEKAIGSTADAWLRMQAAYDLAEVRKREGEINVKRFQPRSDSPQLA